MKLQCNSCGGTYQDTDKDGMNYFHACSPEIFTTRAVEVAGIITKAEVRAPRPNPRDENIDQAALATATANLTKPLVGPPPIKAPGLGVTQI
jgi:hypothetical protein